ncbi:MAG TPA: MFS transporter [Candidatus Deferrimicrobium sp.]|nr:MFS transporter [Candidatus Deferrimicrobium sp.]
MNRSELLRLAVGQIGTALGYMILTMNLQSFFQYTAFAGHAWDYTLSFSIMTIAFGAGALTYLFAGYISDKTLTRWGRRRPYLLMAIPGAIALTLLGINYSVLPLIGSFILLSCLGVIFTVTYRLMYTNYWALFMDLTKPEDRVKSTITFNFFGLIGTGIAITIPISSGIGDPINNSYFFITILGGLVFLVFVLLVFFFGPREDLEAIRMQHEQGLHPPSILSSITGTLKNKEFKNYAISAFFASFVYSMAMFILKPFIEWKTEQRIPSVAISFYLILASVLPIALIGFYFCNWASKRWGKRTVYQRALLFGIIAYPLSSLLAAQGGTISMIIQLIFLMTIILFVVVVILSYQNAILMDITPKGQEATYTGVLFFIAVLPIPIASAIAGPILDIFNFDVLGFWIGNDFGYVLIVLIMAISLVISYIFLRRLKYEEVLEA